MAGNSFFHEVHLELEAKLVPSGAWKLPLFYPGGSVAEHRHTVSTASLFDLSGTGCYQLTGKAVGKVLDKLFVYPVSALAVGGTMENILLYENGNFAAMFTLNRMQDEDFMLQLDRNTPAKERDFLVQTMEKNKVSVRDLSGAMAMLALLGPESGNILKSAGAQELPEKGMWKMITVTDDEGDSFRAIAVYHERFGLEGFDLCVNPDNAVEFYGALYRINGVAPAGTGAWESLRIESGTPGTASELHRDISPAECGIGTPGVPANSRLVMIESDRYAALPGSVVKNAAGIAVGVVTSGAYCPVAARARMFCRMENGAADAAGKNLLITVNGRDIPAILL
ncbi:MAG: aminomethyltransferase family protein [Lentisphaeria bacterium]|nr:aminomethyltransferase family protein [Lentisphaeria bacterium]